MKITNDMLLPNLRVDDRTIKLSRAKHQVVSLIDTINSHNNTVRDYTQAINSLKAQMKSAKKDVKIIEEDIKKNSAEVEIKKFYDNQILRLKGLPLTKFKMFTFESPIGETGQVMMMITKPLSLVETDDTERSRYMCTKAGRKIGRYLVVIHKTPSRSLKVRALCLDNNAHHSLPCISGANCCLGNLASMVASRWDAGMVGNVAEIMVDFFTSSTFGNPYINPESCWDTRRISEKNLTAPELVAQMRKETPLDILQTMMPEIMAFVGDKLLPISYEDQGKRSRGQGLWIEQCCEPTYLTGFYTPPVVQTPVTPTGATFANITIDGEAEALLGVQFVAVNNGDTNL